MDLEGFKKAFPKNSVHETRSSNKNFKSEDANVVKYKGGSGKGYNQITDWVIEIKIPYEKYGSGISSIKYTKFLPKVDVPTFQNNLKDDLVKKYGKPDLEYVGYGRFDKKQIGSYYYCWGSRCGVVKGINWPVNYADLGRVPEGKYLLVKYAC